MIHNADLIVRRNLPGKNCNQVEEAFHETIIAAALNYIGDYDCKSVNSHFNFMKIINQMIFEQKIDIENFTFEDAIFHHDAICKKTRVATESPYVVRVERKKKLLKTSNYVEPNMAKFITEQNADVPVGTSALWNRGGGGGGGIPESRVIELIQEFTEGRFENIESELVALNEALSQFKVDLATLSYNIGVVQGTVDRIQNDLTNNKFTAQGEEAKRDAAILDLGAFNMNGLAHAEWKCIKEVGFRPDPAGFHTREFWTLVPGMMLPWKQRVRECMTPGNRKWDSPHHAPGQLVWRCLNQYDYGHDPGERPTGEMLPPQDFKATLMSTFFVNPNIVNPEHKADFDPTNFVWEARGTSYVIEDNPVYQFPDWDVAEPKFQSYVAELPDNTVEVDPRKDVLEKQLQEKKN